MIIIDTREQNGDFIKQKFDAAGVESEIATLPYASGCDYLIAQSHGSCGIQRKDSTKELIGQMEELRTDILPRLISYTDNPVLLVEESHQIGEAGYLFRRENGAYVETGLHSSAYYGFLESTRMTGVDVVCTRDLNASIWYMIAMDGYLSRQHYPKPLKSYKPHQSALGMLCCVPTIGAKRAEKALSALSIKEMIHVNEIEGLTKIQTQKLKKVLGARL